MNIRLERQGSVDCNMTAVKVVANIYTKSISLGRNAKQAKKIYKQVNNKFSKCATAFVDPAKALGEGTKLGTTCDKAVANSTIQKDYITLNNCSVSSCALCDTSGLGVDEARLDTCETQLKNVSDTAIVSSTVLRMENFTHNVGGIFPCYVYLGLKCFKLDRDSFEHLQF